MYLLLFRVDGLFKLSGFGIGRRQGIQQAGIFSLVAAIAFWANSRALVPFRTEGFGQVAWSQAARLRPIKSRCRVERKGFAQLLSDPGRAWTVGDRKVHDPPSFMVKHYKEPQQTKSHRRHGKEVNPD